MSGPAETLELPPVVRDVAGQDEAAAVPGAGARRPHHAYLFTGPEGSGKRLGLRAFAAALLCPDGGCGECRDCRLALGERHPNMVVLEPTGPDILVGKDATDPSTARGFARAAYLTPQEPGRKVMVVLQADRLRTEAADVLLKVLEEPPGDTVIVLLSARPADLPDTIRSRCQEIVFPPLTEAFVVETLAREGVDPDHARLVSRLAGGNIGRARRMARDESGLAFRGGRAGGRRTGVERPGRSAGRGRGADGGGQGLPDAAREPTWKRSSGRSWTSTASPRRRSGRWCAGSRSSTSAACAGPSASSWTRPCRRCRAGTATPSCERSGSPAAR